MSLTVSDDPELAHFAGTLLLKLLRARVPDETGPLEHLPQGTWERVGDLAVRHRVAPLLSRRLGDLRLYDRLPVAVLERLQGAYNESAARSVQLRSELAAVLAAFRAKELRVIVLKGAYLAEHVYEDPALRPMRDLDLLLHEEDLAQAIEELTGLGYRPSEAARGEPDYSTHRHLRPFVRPGAFPIEIHRAIEEPCTLGETDLPALWERARPVQVAGVEALVLSWEDLLLHLCLHIVGQHGFQVGLYHLIDVPQVLARCIDELDWQSFVHEAERSGTRRFCFYLLATAEGMLGAKIPAGILSSLDGGESDADLVPVITEYVLLRPMYPLSSGLGDALQAMSAVEKCKAVCRSVFPPPQILREIYSLRPGTLNVLGYYALRPWDLLLRRGPFLLRLGSPKSSARYALDLEVKKLRIQKEIER